MCQVPYATCDEETAPLSLSVHWRSLSVSFGSVRALAPCSGDAEAGQLVALMGSTGAGKTTLLNAIAARGPVTSGEVWYGDNLMWSKALKRHVAYVEQDDHCFAQLTVRETLLYAARLRLPRASLESKTALVSDTIALLRLQSCACSKVGSPLERGISGGERKRLMVGQEMLTNPRLLCCDEPTSGLDSTTAIVVIEALHDLASQRGVATVASIHQPSSRIFLLFDQLVLLDKEGIVYRGSTAAAADAFVAPPFDLPCPRGFSAADWLMDICVRGEFASAERCCAVALDAVVDDKTRAARRVEIVARYGVGSVEPRAEGALVKLVSGSVLEDYAAPLKEQFTVLAVRSFREVRPLIFDRDQVLLHVGNSVLAGLLWFQLGHKEQDIFSRLTLAFAIPIAWVFFPMLNSLAIVPANEVMLKKELSTNSYLLSTWYIVTTTCLLLPMLAQSLLYTALVLAFSDISSEPIVWGAAYAIIVLAIFTFQSIGLLMSAAVPAKNLMTVAMLYVTFCFLFIGLFVPVKDSALPFLTSINPMIYVFALAARAFFVLDGANFKCGDLDRDGTAYPKSCHAAGDGFISPGEIMRENKLATLSPTLCVGVLVAYMAAARVLAFLLLRRRMTTLMAPKQQHTAAAQDTQKKTRAAVFVTSSREHDAGVLKAAAAPPLVTARIADRDAQAPDVSFTDKLDV